MSVLAVESRTSRIIVSLALLWLIGNALRLTILAVPPVIASIARDLELSATQVGLLNSLPAAMFALAALPGSLLVARLGIKGTMLVGLATVALGSALRAYAGHVLTLYAATIAMGGGVAILQPAMPAAVREWVPTRIALGTAVYTNGLLVGEVLPVMLTIPWVLPWVDGEWRAALLVWSMPVIVIALATTLMARGRGVKAARQTILWWPDWKSGFIWRLTVLFGTVNSMYFGANAFIPIYLVSRGEQQWIGPALTGLNLGQLPASALLLVFAAQLERRMWPYVSFGLLALFGVLGIVTFGGAATMFFAGALGFACGGGLILGLTLPPLLSAPGDVARTSAAVFTVSYASAVAIAVVSGLLWDLSGTPALSFVPLGLCAFALVAVAFAHRRRGELR